MVPCRARASPRSFHSSADFLDTLSTPEHKDTYYSRTALYNGTSREGREGSLFPPLSSSKEVDVVIIGGGLAGVNTAHSLAQRGKSVVCLEAGKIGWAASGRNGGFAHPGFSLGMGDLVKQVGLNHTRALWNLTFDSMSMIRQRVKKWEGEKRTAVSSSIQPGMLTCSWFNDPKATQEDVAFGNEVLGREYFQYWPKSKVRELYSTDKYYDGVYDPDSFHFHSLNYALEVARDAKEIHGASIHEKTAATRVELLDSFGERKRVHTSTGATVTAQHLVVAGSAYLPSSLDGAGVEHIRRALLPVMTYACVTEPLGEQGLKEIIRAPHAVTDSRFACDYYRPLPDTRLLWGGRIDCMGIDQAKLPSVLHADMCKVYPQLAKSTKVQVAWSGVMGYARHKMPLIGKLTSTGNPFAAFSSSSKDVPRDVWYCTGFGGHGVCPTTVAGEVIAKAIAEGDDSYRLFKPFGLEWTGGPYIGAAAAQAFYWWYSARDMANAFKKNGKAAI